MSESSASRSTIFPLPSSPHCAPTMTVAGTGLPPRHAASGGRAAVVKRTCERSSHVLLCGVDESTPWRSDNDCRGHVEAVCQSAPMSIAVALLVFAGGFVLTVASSVVLARELDRIGERLGFSEALLGIVAALGADAPEIASALAAVIAGHEDTGVGVVVGSNVFNLAALLGVSALNAERVRIHRHGLLLNGGVAIVVAIIGAFVAMDLVSGALGLVLTLVVLTPYVVLSALHERGR